MEVLNKAKYRMLSNYEVKSLLKEVNNEMTSGKIKNQNLSTIVYEVGKYLSSTPCEHQDSNNIKSILKDMKSFNLTKAEKLQIINQRPTTEVEIALIVEESEERLSEDEVAKLIVIVNQLPYPEEDKDVEEMDEE